MRRALDEDLGRAGDVTSTATIPETAQARAIMVARQAGTLAGLPLAIETFNRLSPDIRIEAHARDGAAVAKGIHVLTIQGPARAVLAGERTALNFVGRLSGIATLTSNYVRHTAGTKLRICCTRKTTPGLRALEKYAVRCGGGFNHRFGLDDAILIKDNHIAVAGGVKPVLERARAVAGHLVKIEIEVDSLDTAARRARHGPGRCRAARQHGHGDADRSGEDQRRAREAGSLWRRDREHDCRDCGDGRGLCIVRRADAFGAEFRYRAGYRSLRQEQTPRAPASMSAGMSAVNRGMSQRFRNLCPSS